MQEKCLSCGFKYLCNAHMEIMCDVEDYMYLNGIAPMIEYLNDDYDDVTGGPMVGHKTNFRGV